MKKHGYAFNAVLADLPFSAADCWAPSRNCRTLAAVPCTAGWTQPPGASAKYPQSFFPNTDFWRRTFTEWNRGGLSVWWFYKISLNFICRADLKSKIKRGLPINKLHPGPKICSSERTGEAWAVSDVPTAYDTVTNDKHPPPQKKANGEKKPKPQ